VVFRFDAAQQFQLDAIAAVTSLLEGQSHIGAMLLPAAGATVVPNGLELTEDQLLENLNRIQADNAIPVDASLRVIEQTVELYEGNGQVRFPNFSVEMETGTGKTYVYLRTILALASRYGLTKFIIVVPSVAVREGVLKTIQQTKKHFAALPGLPPFHHSVYAAQPGQVRSFASSNAVEILVMTIDAFSREQNVIRKGVEGNAPVIHLLQAVRPVLILDDPRVNVLTVAASESYERFVGGLQGEIERAYGKEGLPPKPGNAREKIDLKLRKHYLLKPEFQELWNKIKYRTRYAVTIDSAKLIGDVVADMIAIKVRRPRVVVQIAGVNTKKGEDLFEAIRLADASVAIDLEGRYPLPNVVSVVEKLMEATSPPMRIGRKTILAILKAAPEPKAVLDNPQEFATALVGIIKTKLADQLVAGIQYERDGTWYEQSQFDGVIEAFVANVVKSETNGLSGGTHIYDGADIDSETIERPFAEALERDARVKLYVKLPRWFQVTTPIGSYNPDWAIVMDLGDGQEKLYLVRETKGTAKIGDLRPDERRKIECGRKHFVDTLKVNYAVATTWP
jgi:restriction endonuclease